MDALHHIISEEIRKQGVIGFARFMELALYCPEYGYYERESDTIGRCGDFYTSVSVGSLFGELLGFQFVEWVTKNPAGEIKIVEAAAHDGKLARDILGWIKRSRPDCFERLHYCIVEPSSKRRTWQGESLKEFLGKVSWAENWEADLLNDVNGVIFANELLDAMPVSRLGWDAINREWFEWGVALDGDRFGWEKMGSREGFSRIRGFPDELLAVLPDGFIVEESPSATDWWRTAASKLRSGNLVTFDYGHRSESGLSADRPQGTLRAFRKHRVTADILADAGSQDITADVDFSAIEKAGFGQGLRTESFQSQASFLMGVLKQMTDESAGQNVFTVERSREFQTLIHPEHLGRAFRVLVQSR